MVGKHDDGATRFESICGAFERAWLEGETPQIEEFIVGNESVGNESDVSVGLFEELLCIEFDFLAQRGMRPIIDEYHSRFPERQASIERIIAELNPGPLPYVPSPAPETVNQNALDTSPIAASSPALCAGDLVGEHEILDVIGVGGMGVVYRCRHRQLERIVALKMIRSEFPVTPEHVSRFRIETQAAARLDHPGIVPVYDSGDFNGAPFYSMAFVDGESLSEAVRENPFAPRRSAEVCRDLAQAIQFAHDNGVIHRDLKPQNVLMDGEQPRVTDFGLARIQRGDSELTSYGQILGTPNYMSPEQAAGQTSEIGIAADIYSLGAILYRTLVGRPPFQAPTTMETLRLVLDQDPVSVRQMNGQIDKDLEIICMRCLAKDPEKRFPSADALSEDLQRYLDGRPIQSRATGVAERLWLWCRRRRAVASLTFSLIAVFLIGFALVVWKWREAESANDLALANLGEASTAVSQFYRIVADSRLLNEPGLQPLRRELLENAVKYQRRFIETNGDSPELALHLADAQMTVGKIHALLGNTSLAIEDFQTADRAFQKARRLDPQSASVDIGHCQCLQLLARNLLETTQLAQSEAALKRSGELAQLLVRKNTQGRDERDLLATNHSLIGSLRERQGENQQATSAYVAAIEINRQLIREAPDVTTYAFNLAVSLQNYAIVQRLLGDSAGAEKSLDEAIQIYAGIDHLHVDQLGVHEQLQMAEQHLAIVKSEVRGPGQHDVASDLIEKWQRLVKENPNVVAYRINLLIAYTDRCFSMLRSARSAEAIRFGELAVATGKELIETDPDNQEVITELGDAWEKVGLAHMESERPTQAVDSLLNSLKLLRSLDEQESPIVWERTGSVLLNLGTVQLETGDDRAATTSFKEARELAQRLVDKSSDVPTYRLLLAKALRNLGIVEVEAGNRAGFGRIQQGLEIVRKSIEEGQPNVEYEIEYLQALQMLVFLKLESGESGLAADVSELIDALERHATRVPDDQQAHFDLAFNRGFLGQLLADDGEQAEAREVLVAGIAGLEDCLADLPPELMAGDLLATMKDQLADLPKSTKP